MLKRKNPPFNLKEFLKAEISHAELELHLEDLGLIRLIIKKGYHDDVLEIKNTHFQMSVDLKQKTSYLKKIHEKPKHENKNFTQIVFAAVDCMNAALKVERCKVDDQSTFQLHREDVPNGKTGMRSHLLLLRGYSLYQKRGWLHFNDFREHEENLNCANHGLRKLWYKVRGKEYFELVQDAIQYHNGKPISRYKGEYTMCMYTKLPLYELYKHTVLKNQKFVTTKDLNTEFKNQKEFHGNIDDIRGLNLHKTCKLTKTDIIKGVLSDGWLFEKFKVGEQEFFEVDVSDSVRLFNLSQELESMIALVKSVQNIRDIIDSPDSAIAQYLYNSTYTFESVGEVSKHIFSMYKEANANQKVKYDLIYSQLETLAGIKDIPNLTLLTKLYQYSGDQIFASTLNEGDYINAPKFTLKQIKLCDFEYEKSTGITP